MGFAKSLNRQTPFRHCALCGDVFGGEGLGYIAAGTEVPELTRIISARAHAARSSDVAGWESARVGLEEALRYGRAQYQAGKPGSVSQRDWDTFLETLERAAHTLIAERTERAQAGKGGESVMVWGEEPAPTRRVATPSPSPSTGKGAPTPSVTAPLVSAGVLGSPYLLPAVGGLAAVAAYYLFMRKK